MKDFWYILKLFICLLLFSIQFITGFSYYFNKFNYIQTIKIKFMQRKYNILDVERYLNYCGIKNLLFSLVFLILYILLYFKKWDLYGHTFIFFSLVMYGFIHFLQYKAGKLLKDK